MMRREADIMYGVIVAILVLLFALAGVYVGVLLRMSL